MKRSAEGIILMVVLLATVSLPVVGQETMTGKQSLITLHGQVSCLKPERGLLPDVTVFNKNKEWGTLTYADGTFSVKMGKNDTIVFSTALHEDYHYYLKSDIKFEDHSIEITMEPDAIWLETVTILGNQSLEEFKNEIMQLNHLESSEVNITTPIISKYARQLSTGDGELLLVRPLTYLSQKFSRYQRLKSRFEDPKSKKNDH